MKAIYRVAVSWAAESAIAATPSGTHSHIDATTGPDGALWFTEGDTNAKDWRGDAPRAFLLHFKSPGGDSVRVESRLTNQSGHVRCSEWTTVSRSQ